MTLDELYADIENLQEANAESWEDFCGCPEDMGYYAGFDAACNEILKLIAAGEAENAI